MDLSKALKPDVKSRLCLSEKMTHNEFDFYTDLVRPSFEFFLEIGFETAPNQRICMLDINKCYYEDLFFKENKPMKQTIKSKIKRGETGVQMVRAT